jgi:hypothetical protein
MNRATPEAAWEGFGTVCLPHVDSSLIMHSWYEGGDGRATESCLCGHYAYVKTRCERVDLRQGAPVGGHASGVFTAATHAVATRR